MEIKKQYNGVSAIHQFRLGNCYTLFVVGATIACAIYSQLFTRQDSMEDWNCIYANIQNTLRDHTNHVVRSYQLTLAT